MDAGPAATTFPTFSEAEIRTRTLPWYCIAIVFGAGCIPLGAIWDISWHLTIGRDTFWTPAHVLIYFGGSLAGCASGWVVLKNTFWPDAAEREATVRLWGFRGPLGAWVVIWGSFAMLVSAPFDNWWHDAYGLDVQIISVPHSLLALGIYAVAIGGLMLLAARVNRPDRDVATVLVFLVACAVLVTEMSVFLTEHTYPNHQHAASFYLWVCHSLPLWLVIAHRSSGIRWAATGASAIYMAVTLGTVWILPLFHATPMLAPIYNPIDHMVPPPFPLLLIIPALGIDLLMAWLGKRHGFWRDTGLAFLLGIAFFVLLLAAQWRFATFLLSPASRNWFFAGDSMWGYGEHLGEWRTAFWNLTDHPFTMKTAVYSILFAALTCRVALWLGAALSRVKR
jgi:hypothetical protein